MPEGIPLRHRSRRNRVILIVSPEPNCDIPDGSMAVF
jgi:hypothetical protein